MVVHNHLRASDQCDGVDSDLKFTFLAVENRAPFLVHIQCDQADRADLLAHVLIERMAFLASRRG
jgi:hypothetical protein